MKALLIAPPSSTGRLLAEALRRRRHEVEVIANVDDACTALASGGHGLVVLAAKGPGDEDARTCRLLRNSTRDRRCMILAAGPPCGPEQLTPLFEAGADDYLSDPDDAGRLEVRLAVAEHHLAHDAARQGNCEASDRSSRPFCPAVQYIPCGVFRADVEARLLAANPALVAMLGYVSEQEILGLSIVEAFCQDPAACRELHAQLLDCGSIQGVEVRWLRKDGSPIVVLGSARVLRDDAGRATAIEAFVVDVTERKEADERLREGEHRYRLIAENVTDLVWTAAMDDFAGTVARLGRGDPAAEADDLMRRLQFTYVSPSAERFLGFTPEQIRGMSMADLLAPESYAEASAVLIEELLDEQRHPSPTRTRVATLRHLARDGSVRFGEVKATLLRDEQMQTRGLLGVTRDVTERMQAEEALRTSEATLRSLFENLPDLVILVAPDGAIQSINRDVATLSAGDAIGRLGFEFIAPDFRDGCRKSLERAVAAREPQTVDCLDVFGRRWACRLVPLAGNGSLRSVMIICTDVTEQERAYQAVKKEQRLLRQLLDLNERDRQLTAYEIHDGFSQYLTGALFSLQGFRDLHARNPAEAWRTFDAGVAMIRRSIDETRRLIGGLRPPILDESGVVAAIEYLACEAAESPDARIEFTHDVQLQRLAPPLESAIFRIVQESLTNARRHSQSERILIDLRQRGDQIHVDVRDWGVGFNPAKVAEGRFGLQGIRERVRLVGGQITIDTAPDEGTHIHVELPVIQAAEDPAIP